MPDYQKLDVWRKAHALAVEVHRALPETTSQRGAGGERLATAALDVPLAIARGATSERQMQFADELACAALALCDVHYLLRFDRDVGVISDVSFARLEARVLQLRAMLASLERVVSQRVVARRTRPAAQQGATDDLATRRRRAVENPRGASTGPSSATPRAVPRSAARAPAPPGDQGSDSS